MGSDENPYFDASVAGRSAAADPARVEPETPTTPARELPPAAAPPASLARTVRFLPLGDRQQSSIRLRRWPANVPPPREATIPGAGEPAAPAEQPANNSRLKPWDRLRAGLGTRSRAGSNALPLSKLPTIQDDVPHDFQASGSAPAQAPPQFVAPVNGTNEGSGAPAPVQRVPVVARENRRPGTDEYDSYIVDFLDVIDPEVATLSSITNVQNSLFVPSLGRFINRRPTYDLSLADRIPGAFPQYPEEETEEPSEPASRQTTINRTYSITSHITPSHYAVLPTGASLEGWSREEVDQLNDHVRHMLHSKRSRLKRRMKAFGQYVRRPLGFAVTLYGTLITLFGLAWVLFLIGWISVGDKQLYVINVIDNVLVALFAIVGDGLAPFRAVDTYHMIYIAHYHRLTWKLRKRMSLPELENKNDLPRDQIASDLADPEAGRPDESPDSGKEVSVLSPKQQKKLVYHQTKMAKSHTFYKPNETETHYAFPISFLIAIVVLLDLHSCLQICLGSVTWAIDYHRRSTALTTTILCCSIAANTTAGILIALGDRRTRKKDVIERMFRQELTDDAMRKVQKEKAEREAQEAAARKDASQAGKFDASTSGVIRPIDQRALKDEEAEDAITQVPGGFPR